MTASSESHSVRKLEQMKIAFLLDNAYGIGGTIRSTVNLSRALADRHTVEVASLRRNTEKPALPFDPRVKLIPLLDLRKDSRDYDGDDPLFHRPSRRFTEGTDHFERGIATHLGDQRIRDYLHRTDADVVIATRPKLNDYLAAYGSDRYVRIGQEHLTREMHVEHVRSHQDAAIRRLDAFVTVSYADAAHYREALGARDENDEGTGVRVVCVPNAVPAADIEPSDGESKLIVAAGRLIKIKRYDRLLNAFALVSEKHPDWKLRLYGRGKRQPALRAHIDSLGLSDRAFLMGAHSPIEPEWAKGAIAAVSSDAESFGMTLVEAMHCGVPVVSTDCPYGPGEILTNGKDGLLAPLADEESFTVRAYADALLQLVESPDLRRRMGQAALLKAARYAPDRVAAEYEQLIGKLLAERPVLAAARPARGARQAQPPEGADAGAATSTVTGSDGAGASSGAGDGSGAGDRPGASGGAGGKGKRPGGKRRGRPSLRRLLRRLLRPSLRRRLAPLLRPVRRLLRGQRPVPRKAPASLPRPQAHVRVAADGSVVVRLRAKRLPEDGAALLLRTRHGARTETVRVPLPPRGAAVDGWTETRLDRSGHRLAEARWDLYVERERDGKRKRVRADLVETARLLSLPVPLDEDGAVAPWIPYTTADGYLALRTWRRQGHAEVTSIALGREAFHVEALLYGAAGHPEALREAAVLAVARTDKERGFEVPVSVTSAADGADGPPSVAFELPYDLPGALDSGSGDAVWDLWLRPGGQDAAAVRLARLLDDLAARKKTDVLPRARLGDSGTGVRAYFSVNNDLALALQPVPEEEPQTADTMPEQAPAERTPHQTGGHQTGGRPAQGHPSSPRQGQSPSSSPSASARA
ncbi:glycosyltransferase family 4 protein [Streptomyces sp. NPDC054796]